MIAVHSRSIGPLLVLCAALAGCGVPSGHGIDPPTNQVVAPDGIRAGRIRVELSTGVVHVTSSDSADRYWRYEIDPSTGQVAETAAGVGALEESRLPNGRSGCAKPDDRTRIASSPDGRFQLRCAGEDRGTNARFTVTEVAPMERVVVTWAPQQLRRISGFAWSPSSELIAVLSYSQATGTGLLDRVWASVGHPPPYMTFYLDLINVPTAATTEYVLRRDLPFGEGGILDWKPPRAAAVNQPRQ